MKGTNDLDLDLRPWLREHTPPDWLDDEDEEDGDDEGGVGVSALALDPGGRHLALGLHGSLPRVQLISLETGEPALALPLEEDEKTFFAFHTATHVSFSPDGRRLLARTVNVDNGNTLAFQLRVFDLASGDLTHQVSPDADEIASTGIGVSSAAWHGDQILIAHLQREIERCDAEGAVLRTYAARDNGGAWYVGALAMDAAGTTLAWHDHAEVVLWRDGVACPVPLPDGWCEEHSDSAIAVTDDGVLLAIIGAGGGRLLRVDDAVEELARLPDARRVAALDAVRREALFLDEAGASLLQPAWGDVPAAVFPLPLAGVRATAVGGGRVAVTDGRRVAVRRDPRR